MNAAVTNPEAFILSEGSKKNTFRVILAGETVFSSKLCSECERFMRVFSRFPAGTWKMLEELKLWAKTLQSLNLNSESILELFEALSSVPEESLPDADLDHYYSQESAIAHYFYETVHTRGLCSVDYSMVTSLVTSLVYSQLELTTEEFTLSRFTEMLRSIVTTVETGAGFPLNAIDPSTQRFLVHLRFLALRILRRTPERHEVDLNWYREYTEKFPDAFRCVVYTAETLEEMYGYHLGTDERFYLLIHLVQLMRIHNGT